MSQDWYTNAPTYTNDAEDDIGKMRLMYASLRTAFSGATAPASPVSGQFWYDTTNHILKIRNEANTAWLEIFDLTTAGGISGRQVFTSSGSLVVPAGIFTLIANAGAAGGGGGGGSDATKGCGGAGGTLVYGFPIPVTPGETVTVTIGAKGTGGAGAASGAVNGSDGTSGGDLVISCSAITLTLPGGPGGEKGYATFTASSGGAGLTLYPIFRAGGGDDGGGTADGADGESTFFYSGGSGGVGGPHAGGGGGGAGINGNGAAGGSSGAAGNDAAVNSGGGGGGGSWNGSSGLAGGDGGEGYADLRW